ncbi:MAG: carbon monoxide dehydrogenase, partial [Chloroflexota bacterium]|nr:carbon monoxide dehydrogenase [Chloroflexota bacterium]
MTTDTPEVHGMGHSVKRKEDARFLRGKGHYVDDIKLPAMLYMDIVRSPYAHANITKIDASRALALPGVLAVVTGKDLDAAGLAWMPTLMSDKQMVLPVDRVVYQAQEVAAVIATERYIAADAITMVDVEYEPLPPVMDPFKALEPDAPLVRPDREQKTNHIWHWEAGDAARTDEMFKNAEVIIQQDLYIPRI